MEGLWFSVVFWIALGGAVGRLIGKSKGREIEGLVLGLLLGFIGWLIIAVMPQSEELRGARQAETIALAAAVVGTSQAPSPTSPPDRYDTVEHLGRLRASEVLTAAEFNALKSFALGGGELVRLDEVERVDRLHSRGLLDDDEFDRLAGEIVDDNLARAQRHSEAQREVAARPELDDAGAPNEPEEM